MKVAILSDIHDNIWNLRAALKEIIEVGIDTAILCGDYCSPTAFKIATIDFRKAYCVWGNVDGDRFKIAQKIYTQKIDHVELLNELGEIEIDGRSIALNHYPDIGERLAQSGQYDAVFHGHTHLPRNEMIGNTLLVNPGSICGFKNEKDVQAGYAIYNTKTNSAEIFNID